MHMPKKILINLVVTAAIISSQFVPAIAESRDGFSDIMNISFIHAKENGPYITYDPAGEWVKKGNRWWYRYPDGTYPADAWIVLNGRSYRFDKDGYMQTGWVEDQGSWYYLDPSSGAMKTNDWQGDYYLGEDGAMAVDTDVDGGKYHVGPDGRWNPEWGIGKWVKSSKGWWYDDGRGGFPADTVYKIDGSYYGFDENGYMVTGWHVFSDDWYYFESSGVMKTNAWQGDFWLLADGKMAVNMDVDGGRYHVGADGRWDPQWGIARWEQTDAGWRYNDGYNNYYADVIREINGYSYYFDADGYMGTGWKNYGGERYYFLSDGKMKTSGWQSQYYLKADGRMAKNELLKIGADTYLFNSTGRTLKGWQEFEGKHYYFASDGKMCSSVFQDGYYLKEDGTRAENEKVKVGNETYRFKEQGLPVSGWQEEDYYWFFYEESGRMKHSEWEGSYWLLENGRMAESTFVDNNTAFVDGSGKKVTPSGKPEWDSDSVGWWLHDAYGNYPVSSFVNYYGSTYYFDSIGYMVTGWEEIESEWYFFYEYGGMAKNHWMTMYYLKSDGTYAHSETLQIDGTAYTFDASGRCVELLKAPGWHKRGSDWWYSYENGSCPVNRTADINGKTYRFDFNGDMMTEWYYDGQNWYYFGTNGAMQKSSWVKVDEDWYYFHEDGTMAADEFIDDNYYVGSDGAWVRGLGPDLTLAPGVSSDHIMMRGIDISEHNGDIDLSNYIGEFVIIRIGYCTTPDRRAVRNMNLCDKYNIPYGVYLYDYTTDTQGAKEEAEFTLQMIKGRNIRCGVWFDMEDCDGWKARNGLYPTDSRISQICQTYCKTISDAGYHVGIYASYSWFGTYIKGCDNYDVWVAHWGVNDGKMNSNLSWMASLHQYTSVPLDKDVMYVNLSELKGK